MKNQIRSKYYRISAKALILNEARDAFLITKEEDGLWELPGGGIEWGESAQDAIKREVAEEMGITVTKVANTPAYFISCRHKCVPGRWIANIVYETSLEHLNFTPSAECTDVAFVHKLNSKEYDLFPNVHLLLEQFDPVLH